MVNWIHFVAEVAATVTGEYNNSVNANANKQNSSLLKYR
jgi:hypothetical protein